MQFLEVKFLSGFFLKNKGYKHLLFENEYDIMMKIEIPSGKRVAFFHQTESCAVG